jgi:predicted dehydrogenase
MRLRTLRVGLVGLGSMGKNHARVLTGLPETELVAIHDAASVAREHLGVKLVPGLEDLVALGLDYCVVATPTATHLEVADYLAANDVPALIEKPVTLTALEARGLAARFDVRGVPAAVGHIERFNPAVIALRQRLSDHGLGEVFQVATRRLSPLPARVGDVGVIHDLATHDIDITRFILGAEYGRLHALVRSRPGRDYEDALSVLAEMTDRTVVSHLVNWVSPMKERIITVTGDRGMYVADTVFADLTYFANGAPGTTWEELAQFGGVVEGDVTRFALRKVEPLRSEHEDFRALLEGRPNVACSILDGAQTVEVAERMRLESSRPDVVPS